MSEAATSHQSRAEMGKWVWRRRGSLSQTEPQTCAHKGVKRLVQRNLPSRSAGGEDASPALFLAGHQVRQPILPLPDKGSDQWAPLAWAGWPDRRLHPAGEVLARVREGKTAPLHEHLPQPSAAHVSRARRRGPSDSHVLTTPCPLAHPLGPGWENLKPCSE